MKSRDEIASIFIDTNIFLHFQPFDQIKWTEVLGYKQICIYIPPIIITDLNKYKRDNQSRRRKDRSQAVLKKFSDLVQNMIPGDFQINLGANVTIVFLVQSVDITPYAGLLQSEGDDQIIGSILNFEKNNPNVVPDNVILVTDDIGLKVKCKSYGIRFFSLPDNFRLSDEPTEEEQKIKKLEQVLSSYINKEPKLNLVFLQEGEEQTELHLSVEIISDLDPVEIDRLCRIEENEIKWKSPMFPSINDQTKVPELRLIAEMIRSTQKLHADFLRGTMDHVSENDINKYKVEVLKYIESYKQYIPELFKWKQISGRTREIEFVVYNDGSCPAQDVIIHIEVPDGLVILDPDNLDEEPVKPKRPEKPKTGLLQFLHYPISSNILPAFHATYLYKQTANGNEDDPVFVRYNSTTIEWRVGKIPHKRQLTVSLEILFPIITNEHCYNIEYTISADNLKEPIDDFLVLHTKPTNLIL
ncbi:MAG: PIN domain-containing protein [Anaerolineae bacterium]